MTKGKLIEVSHNPFWRESGVGRVSRKMSIVGLMFLPQGLCQVAGYSFTRNFPLYSILGVCWSLLVQTLKQTVSFKMLILRKLHYCHFCSNGH